MPIRKEERDRYPANWRAISDRIRFERAGGRCECHGECGRQHVRSIRRHDRTTGELEPVGQDFRCTASHGMRHPVTCSKVVLTVAHLNHQPEDCRDDNLRAFCQRCHLAYDRDHHAKVRESRRGR